MGSRRRPAPPRLDSPAAVRAYLARFPPGQIADAIMELPADQQDQLAADEARSGFGEFVRQAWPQFDPAPLVWNWHHDAIADHMQAVAAGTIRKLLITVPPRTGKTSIASICFPAWVWIANPQKQLLYVSYSATLSREHSVKCRQVIESKWYRRMFAPGWRLAADQNVKDDYKNTVDGRRMATSISGHVTGHGGDIIVFDDPLNAEDAHSEPERQVVKRVVDNIIMTRLNNPMQGAIIMVLQRLHQDDPVDTFLSAGGVEHLCLPAEYDARRRSRTYHYVQRDDARVRELFWDGDPRQRDGDLLYPQRLSREVLDERKRPGPGRSAGSYEAQFNQLPQDFAGGMFRRADWRFYLPPPALARQYTAPRPLGCCKDPAIPLPPAFDDELLSMDAAFKENPAGSQVAIHGWARAGARRFLTYRHSDWMDFTASKTALEDAARKNPRATRKLIEDKANGTAIINELKPKVPGLIAVEPEGGKTARAAAAQPYQRAGDCYLPEGAPWLEEIISRFAAFPGGKLNDDVDAFSQAMRGLEEQPTGETGRVNWGRR